MLANHKITMFADTVVDDTKIATYGAILYVDTMELTFTSRYIDKEACKIHREVVREDQKKFEDYAYSLQDSLKK